MMSFNDEGIGMPDMLPAYSFDLRPKAQALFREWRISAMRYLPENILVLRDADEAYRALQRSLIQGLSSISDSKPELKNNPEWCVGFMQGYVGSSLSVHWTLSFTPKSEAFRHALWLKATILLMENEPDFIQKVNRLYTYLQDSNYPIADADYNLSEEEAAGHRVLADLTTDDNWEMHRPYLENLLHKDFSETLESQRYIDLPNVEKYFSTTEWEEIIRTNPF